MIKIKKVSKQQKFVFAIDTGFVYDGGGVQAVCSSYKKARKLVQVYVKDEERQLAEMIEHHKEMFPGEDIYKTSLFRDREWREKRKDYFTDNSRYVQIVKLKLL